MNPENNAANLTTEKNTNQKPMIHTIKKLEDFKKRVLSNSQPEAISTGFSELDLQLGGGFFAGLYFIGAISSLGKTTLVGQIANQIAAMGNDVMIFSLEMSCEELMAKDISRLTGVAGGNNNGLSTRHILNKVRSRWTDSDLKLIDTAFEVYEEIADHIYIQEGVGDISVEDVQEEVEKHIQETNKKPIVIIDYIQILAPYSEKYSTDKQNVDKTVLELKRMSRDWGIPVIGISSLNRQNYRESISMAAFKESGSIEYSADVLLGLQFKGMGMEGFDIETAKQASPRDVELKILKNRNGPVGGIINFEYLPKINYFIEVVPKTTPQRIQRPMLKKLVDGHFKQITLENNPSA